MDKSIYERRAEQLDDILSAKLSDLASRPYVDPDAEVADLREARTLIQMEQANASILLEYEKLDQKERDRASADIASDEKHQVEVMQNDLKTRELDLKEADEAEQRKLKARELELREGELALRNRELDIQISQHNAKVDVESKAVNGRIACSFVELAAVILQTAASAMMLTKAMRFETSDNGGILSPKFFNHAFRLK